MPPRDAGHGRAQANALCGAKTITESLLLSEARTLSSKRRTGEGRYDLAVKELTGLVDSAVRHILLYDSLGSIPVPLLFPQVLRTRTKKKKLYKIIWSRGTVVVVSIPQIFRCELRECQLYCLLLVPYVVSMKIPLCYAVVIGTGLRERSKCTDVTTHSNLVSHQFVVSVESPSNARKVPDSQRAPQGLKFCQENRDYFCRAPSPTSSLHTLELGELQMRG